MACYIISVVEGLQEEVEILIDIRADEKVRRGLILRFKERIEQRGGRWERAVVEGDPDVTLRCIPYVLKWRRCKSKHKQLCGKSVTESHHLVLDRNTTQNRPHLL